MKQIIRDGITLTLVPNDQEKNLFYVSEDGRWGRTVYPNGNECWKALCTTHTRGSKGSDGHRKQWYWYFRAAWGANKGIQSHHAVLLAYEGPRPVDKNGEAYQSHHLNFVTTDNRVDNLCWVSVADHKRYDNRQKIMMKILGNGYHIFDKETKLAWYNMPKNDFMAMVKNYATEPAYLEICELSKNWKL